MEYKWIIEIDGVEYEEGTAEYWAAVRSKDHLLMNRIS